MTLRPFFSFYGSKWHLAPKYPAPMYDTIIEPFAGSAGYSLRYPERQVILIEKDPIVAAIWRWLISANPDQIASLPEPKQGESLDDYDLSQEARWLMGFWVNQTGSRPNTKVTKFGAFTHPGGRNRCEAYIDRALSQVESIRHWTIIEADYTSAPASQATWFVDPPYQREGKKYRFGSDQLDYASLGAWCEKLPGQSIVCENLGADWLPFKPFSRLEGTTYRGKRVISQEAVWLNET